jgi:hypothetical protein
MKKNLVFFIFAVTVGLFYSHASAFDLSASTSMPTGTFKIAVSKIDSKGTVSSLDDTWTTQSTTDLGFGALKEVTGIDAITGKPWVVFLPADNSYFAVDTGFSGGGLSPAKSISIGYLAGTNGDLLGERAIVSYVKTTLNLDGTTTDTPLSVPKRLLSDPASVLLSEVSGGWLRLYIGINDGKSGLEPTAKTFGPGDAIGNYSGTLQISYL